MEETVCSMEICMEGNMFKAKVRTGMGDYEEYQHTELGSLLENLYEDMQEEIEYAEW